MAPAGAVVVGLFPGQGSQRVGMGRELAAEFAVAHRTFAQVTAPVRWEEAVQALAALGAPLASGLTRRIAPSLPSVPAGDVDGIARAREALAA